MVLCNQCGSELTGAPGFCTECGAPTNSGPLVEAPPRPPRNYRLLIGISITLLVFAGGALLLFFPKEKENRQLATPTALAASEINLKPAPSQSPNRQGRYFSDSCGAIHDSQTGLEWFIGADRNVTWYEAQSWVVGLAACGGGWRMPTTQEIAALYDLSQTAGTGYYKDGKYFPAHLAPVFNAIGGGSWVWSAERSGAGEARSFNLNQGKPVVYAATNTIYSTRAFAVRGSK